MTAEFVHHRIVTFPRFVTTRHRHAERYELIDELCEVKIALCLRNNYTVTIIGILTAKLHVQIVRSLNPQFEI